uniref:Uncharacterized protein n=1 Tax=Pithovirus LCDPAC01 TaxID=2506600 RepID=A0A481YP53_9VIRU|nr:MAG: hypothetical protein LCDPAC01_02050 [Pithovirus LCDPAC01]
MIEKKNGPSMNDEDSYTGFLVKKRPKYLVNIRDTLVKFGLKRGDLVKFEGYCGYRNEGTMIYDGKNIIELEFDHDEYGHIPSSFHVITEFLPRYWEQIKHNSYVWFDTSLLDISIEDVKIYKGTPYVDFDGYDGKVYYIMMGEFKSSFLSVLFGEKQGVKLFGNYDMLDLGPLTYLPPGANRENVIVTTDI